MQSFVDAAKALISRSLSIQLFLITINFLSYVLSFTTFSMFHVICCFVIFVFVAGFGIRTVQWFVMRTYVVKVLSQSLLRKACL